MEAMQFANTILEELNNVEGTTDLETLHENLKQLRNLCAKGTESQIQLVTNSELRKTLHQWLFTTLNPDANADATYGRVSLMAWQLLANTIVNNTTTQEIVWKEFGDLILENCVKPPLGKHTDIQLMIIYNVFKGGASTLTDEIALKIIIQIWATIIAEKYQENLDFLHFLYEHFIVEGGRKCVNTLMRLTSEERTVFLDYLGSYIQHDSPNGLVHTFLLQHISKEFKMKSDCVLRQLTHEVNKSHPREVYALLRIIACASGSEKYETLYAKDHALFLNVSGLLRCLVAAGKEATNMFTPMSKLNEVAPSSTEVSRDFEAEVSYEMKTLLVRSVANLLYKNEVNQGYCLDTQLMPSLFECTNMDARNPLMKEWSILAIRNACIDCPPIQEIVAKLTSEGVAKNDILEELNLEMGSLRIQPHKE